MALSVLLYGLFFLSIRNQLMHIAFSWNYDLDLSSLRPMSTPLDNMSTVVGTVFRNAINLPLLWLIEGCVLLIRTVFMIIRKRKE